MKLKVKWKPKSNPFDNVKEASEIKPGKSGEMVLLVEAVEVDLGTEVEVAANLEVDRAMAGGAREDRFEMTGTVR